MRAPGDWEPEGSKFTHRKKTNRTKRPPFKVSSSGRGWSAGRYDSLCLQIPACYGHSFSLTCGITYRDTHARTLGYTQRQTDSHTHRDTTEASDLVREASSSPTTALQTTPHIMGEVRVQAGSLVLSHPALPCKPHPSPPLDRAANLSLPTVPPALPPKML